MEAAPKAAQSFVRPRTEILSLLAQQADSHLSVKEFLAGRGIKENTFYYWRKKYGKKQQGAPSQKQPGFAVLDINPTISPENEKLFAEVGRIRIYQPVPAAYLKALVG